MSDYETWRSNYGDGEHAARASFQQLQEARHQVESLRSLRSDEAEERLHVADQYIALAEQERERSRQLQAMTSEAERLRLLINGGFDGSQFLAKALTWAAANGYLRGYHAATSVCPDNGPAEAQVWLQEMIASGELADELSRAAVSSQGGGA